ncbi:gluconokinase [Brevibacillus sp. B_LB10_24]|uniref:gluconokinase n=1 Tax=Brevibacillus sp. B_LB10_24 TaxID=3380645 RepID=UPI0038B6D8EB
MGKQIFYLGIDIGTTSTKGIIANAAGEILAGEQAEYSIYQPMPSFAEQSPEEISRAVWQVIKQLLKSSAAMQGVLGGIGFSSAMHSVILVDEANRPLTRCIIWADSRSAAEAEEIRCEPGLELYHRTGTPIHPMSPLTKLRWMSRFSPELLKRAHKVLSIKEYVLFQLCQSYVVDYSIASTTGMFGIHQLDWDRQALELAGVRREQLSDPVPTTEILSIQNRQLADELGIPLDTPIVVGASDGVLANLGAGASDEETAVITIGTSGAVRTVSRTPRTDRDMKSFCYALAAERWVTGGPFNNGGLSLQWFRDQFICTGANDSKSYDELIGEAAGLKAGSEGLLFLPYLTGERAPYWNAQARGVFFGAGLHHRREHFLRAVLEGVIFCAYSVFRSLQTDEQEIKQLFATGGFVRSPFWLQLAADVFGIPVHVPDSPESACLGAVMLTMLATGAIDSLDESAAMVHIAKIYSPDRSQTGRYQELFGLFEQVYHSVEGHFAALSQFR